MESRSMASLPPFRETVHPRGLSHYAPIVLPGLLAVLGSTYPRVMLITAACAGCPAILAVCIAGLVRRIRQPRGDVPIGSGRDSTFAVTVVLMSTCLLAWTSRGFLWETRVQAGETLAGANGPVAVTVVALEGPEFSQYGPKGSFRALARSEDTPRAGWFGVQAAAYPRDLPEFKPGVPVRCEAVFEIPLPKMNPGGFDYRGYLLGERVFSLAEIQGILSGYDDQRKEVSASSPILRSVVSISLAARAYVERALDSTFPKEDAAVLKGVFLGDRGALSAEDSHDFKRSGFYRFIAICGFHIELVASLTEALLRRFTRRPSLSRIGATIAAFCYAGMSGWSAGALRAFTSSSMRMLAPELRRRYHPLAGLGVSALVVSWFIPYPFRNTGFILSFAGAGGAWLGGIYAEVAARLARSKVDRIMFWADGRGSFWVDILGTKVRSRAAPLIAAAVRAATMSLVLFPVMSLCFTEVSAASFILSGVWGSLAALLVPAAAIAALVPWVGAVCGWAPYVLLQGARTVSRALGQIPLAGMAAPAPSTAEVAALWALIALPLTSGTLLGASRAGEDALGFFRRRRLLAAARRCVLVISATVLLTAAVMRVVTPWPEVTFLYVGQGDCAIIRQGALVMLIDTGTATAFDSHILPYLRHEGITHVDLCVISHLHDDHAGGLPGLCVGVSVRCVAVTPGFREETRALIAQGGELPERSIPKIVELKPGSRYVWAKAALDVVSPEMGRYSTEVPDNESSLAFAMDLGGITVEFWGDSPSSSVSRAFEAHPGLNAEAAARVIKVPHHGSVDGYYPALYERSGNGFLTLSVISVGPNSYGHPSNRVEEAAAKGGSLLRTDKAGAITVRYLMGRAVVSTFVPVPSRRTSSEGRNLSTSH